MWPDFEEGWKVSRVLDAIALSHLRPLAERERHCLMRYQRGKAV
jgi:hypothetical protein